MLASPNEDETAVLGCHCPVKWLCACERYWPNREVGSVYFSAEVGNVYTTYKVSKSKELCPGKMIRK